MNQINSPAFYQGSMHPQQQQNPIQQPQTQQPSQQQQQTLPGMQPTIVSQNPNMAPNPNLIPQQAQISFQSESDIVNDGLVDPIIKCKDLFVQLKLSLQLLLNQLTVVLNPPNENKIQTENQYQQLGKYVENFNRVCDLLVVNLRVGCEAQTISNELKYMSRYYAHMGPMDANRAENPLISSINIQAQRVNEFKGIMQRYLSNNVNVNQQNTNDNLS